MKKVAIYCRVSTQDQNVEMQLRDLRKYAQMRDFEVYKEYIDIGISGAKEKRPQLDAMMDDGRKMRYSVVVCWRFDRFARSSRHLINALHEFDSLGIDFISYSENIDTSSPIGQAIFTIIGAMCQLERDIIKERVIAGMRNAVSKGVKIGRPSIPLDDKKLLKLKSEGLSARSMARRLGVSHSTIIRRLSDLKSGTEGCEKMENKNK